jgi:hypothetical protein
MFLLKVWKCDEAECSDCTNVLNTQQVFLEDARDINSECRQNHGPFLISRIALLLRHHRVGN